MSESVHPGQPRVNTAHRRRDHREPIQLSRASRGKDRQPRTLGPPTAKGLCRGPALVTPQWRRVSPDAEEDFIGRDPLAQLARPLLAWQWGYRQWGVSRGGQRA